MTIAPRKQHSWRRPRRRVGPIADDEAGHGRSGLPNHRFWAFPTWEQRRSIHISGSWDKRDEEPTFNKRKRVRPDCEAWGVVLTNMKVIHITNQIPPTCTQATAFRGYVGFTYQFFLWLVEGEAVVLQRREWKTPRIRTAFPNNTGAQTISNGNINTFAGQRNAVHHLHLNCSSVRIGLSNCV